MTSEKQPKYLDKKERELWKVATATIHSSIVGDSVKMLALHIREKL